MGVVARLLCGVICREERALGAPNSLVGECPSAPLPHVFTGGFCRGLEGLRPARPGGDPGGSSARARGGGVASAGQGGGGRTLFCVLGGGEKCCLPLMSPCSEEELVTPSRARYTVHPGSPPGRAGRRPSRPWQNPPVSPRWRRATRLSATLRGARRRATSAASREHRRASSGTRRMRRGAQHRPRARARGAVGWPLRIKEEVGSLCILGGERSSVCHS